MMCSNCGKQEANFMYTEIINGVKKEINLCSRCANKLGVLDMSFNMPNLDFSNFFGDFLNEYDSLMPSIFSGNGMRTLKCNGCGMDYEEFLHTGKFGCSSCYDVFQEKIEPLLRQLHGDTKHLGKRTMNNVKKVSKIDELNFEKNNEEIEEEKETDKLEYLKEKLKEMIKVENYEEAAKIRDEIKELETKNEKKKKNSRKTNTEKGENKRINKGDEN